MSREVRRVPMDWQHPTVWGERWDRGEGCSRMRLVPRGLFNDYRGRLTDWEREGGELARRQGSHWTFSVQYHLTGFQGREDAEVTVHPVYVSENGTEVDVRDEDHLHELLMAEHARERPNPEDYMPEFPEGAATGWCMYETTSEGTPISPVMGDPSELARWLADNRASSFGGHTATYNQWMRMIEAGWAPSAISAGGVLQSGVEFVADRAGQ